MKWPARYPNRAELRGLAVDAAGLVLCGALVIGVLVAVAWWLP